MIGAVAYVSPYVPPEWIAAHGLRPVRTTPAAVAGATAAGACPFADAFLADATERLAAGEIRAVVATTTCDQMRRGSESVHEAMFLMNVPHSWRTPAAHRTYVSELRRLGRFLVGAGGLAPSDAELVDTCRRFDEGRRALLDARDGMSSRAFAEAVAAFHAQGDGTVEAPAAGPERRRGVPVALVGGPLRRDDLPIHDLIEEAGGRVVLDATDSGERTLPAPFERRRLATDPLLEIADSYFGTIPSVFRRPNSALYEYLRREMDARGVAAAIVVHGLWCDAWRAEAPRVVEFVDRPATAVDLGAGDGERNRAETRIQALLEAAGAEPA